MPIMPKHAKRAPKDIFEGLPNTIAQHTAWIEQMGIEEAPRRSTEVIVVRIERRGIRLLDKDNLMGGTKAIVDALRYAGLIPDDNPEAIDLIITQKKVKKKDTGTLIELTRL